MRNYGYARLGLLIFLLFSGCSYGEYGALVGRYSYTETATIVDVYSLGLNLRPKAMDRGMSFGFRKSSYLFANAEDYQKTRGTYQWLHAPLPPGNLVARANKTTGFEWQMTPEIRRTTFGYLDQVVIQGAEPHENILLKMDYYPNHPGRSNVYFQSDQGEPQ